MAVPIWRWIARTISHTPKPVEELRAERLQAKAARLEAKAEADAKRAEEAEVADLDKSLAKATPTGAPPKRPSPPHSAGDPSKK
jgi:hypothetical protein